MAGAGSGRRAVDYCDSLTWGILRTGLRAEHRGRVLLGPVDMCALSDMFSLITGTSGRPARLSAPRGCMYHENGVKED
eukprot:11177667-Lingulodinium_polyedra.AAC.1